MNEPRRNAGLTRRSPAGFSLVEVTIGMAVVGIVFVALYSGLTSGIASVSMAREDARATQIMAEKLDSIRLYSWDKITALGFTSTAFTAPFVPSASSDPPSELKYSGTVTLGTAPVDNAYRTNMRQLTVSLYWETGSVKRQRSMTTLIAKDGMQNYIY